METGATSLKTTLRSSHSQFTNTTMSDDSQKVVYFFSLFDEKESEKATRDRIIKILMSGSRTLGLVVSQASFVIKTCPITLPFGYLIVEAGERFAAVFKSYETQIKRIVSHMEEYQGVETLKTFIESFKSRIIFLHLQNPDQDLNLEMLIDWYQAYDSEARKEKKSPFSLKEIFFKNQKYKCLIFEKSNYFFDCFFKGNKKYLIHGIEVELLTWEALVGTPLADLQKTSRESMRGVSLRTNG